MRSGVRPTGFYRDRSATCTGARSHDHPMMCAGSMPISRIKLEAGPSRAGRSPKSSGIRASFIREIRFIIANLSRPAERVVAFYNKRDV